MATSTTTTTLPLYWHLSSADRSERLDASVKLIHTLNQFQDDFIAEAGEEKIRERISNSAAEVDHYESWSARLDASNAVDVAYAIRRLIRGLASPRESSRLGFAVALTELLSIIDTVTCEQVLTLLKNASQTTGSMSGQEERDMLFARLFGLKSVVQSGLLTRSKPLRTSSNSPSSLKSFEAFLDELLALGEKKSWLKESCWWTLISVASALHDASVSWKKEAVDSLFTHIYTEHRTWNPEKIAITLKLQRLYPQQDWQALIGLYFKTSDILANANLNIIGRILKDSASEDLDENETAKATAGPWKPQLHFVWDSILDELLEPESSSRTSGKFQDFYRAVVDETLFSSSSSPQRKYWGFEVFQKTLKRIEPSKLQLLFTRNFMRSWINHLSKPDRYLHKIARQVATDVLEIVEKDPKAGFTLVLQLTGANGSHQFDRLTRTKTIESILGKMDNEGVKEYISYLFKQVNEKDSDSFASLDARRAWIIDQLTTLLRKNSIPKSADCIQMALDWLTAHAFFTVSKKSQKSSNCALHVVPEPAFSDELHKTCRAKLLVVLADLIVQPAQHGKPLIEKEEKQAGGEVWLQRVLDTVSTLERDSKHARAIRELGDDEKEIKNEVLAALEEAKATGNNVEAARGVQILTSSLLIKALCDEEEDADWETLEDCIDAAAKLFKPLAGKKKGKKEDKVPGVDEETDRSPIDYIVDIIIGLLELSTAFTRTVANMAFSMMASLVTESTVELILAQLERRDPAEEHSHDEDEGMDEVEASENEEDDENEESTDEEEGDEDDEDNDEEDNEEETNELRKAVEAAIDSKSVNDDSNDSDGDESDEESMDDEQMMQIDAKLAEVFRTRVEERKRGKDTGAQREATYFKNRVLDLVDTFMKKQPSSPLILRFILPLIEIISTSSLDEKQLTDKATGVLRSRFGKPKETVTLDDVPKALELLDSLHQRARKAHTSETLSVISACSLFVTKAVIARDEKAVLQIYKGSISDFVTRKTSSLNTAFILDFIKRFPSQAWDIRTSLTDVAPNAANGFRQAQLFSIIQSLLSALPTPDSKREEIVLFMPSVARGLLRAVSESCSADKPLMTAAQMKEALKDGMQLYRYTKRFVTDSASLASIWKPEGWNDLAQQLEASPQFKASPSLAATCRQISQTVSSSRAKSNKKAMKKEKASLKRKAEVDVTTEINTANDKAKRKKAKKAKPNAQ